MAEFGDLVTWAQRVSAFSVFMGIGAIGFLFLLISLMLGEVFEHGADILGHGLEHGGPSFLSLRGISVFVTAFGGAGAIATHMGIRVLPSSLIGMLTGCLFAGLVFVFATFLHSQQASSVVCREDMIGRDAEVIIAIPGDGLGQVRCLVGETLVDRTARSASGEAIPLYAKVKIESDIAETVTVRRAVPL